MEPITNHIKNISSSITAPAHLKSQVMNAVTNPDRIRTTTEATRSAYIASPFITFIQSKAFMLTSTLALILVIGLYSFSANTITTDQSSSDIIDSLVVSSDTNYTELNDIELIQQEIDIINQLLALDTAVSMKRKPMIG